MMYCGDQRLRPSARNFIQDLVSFCKNDWVSLSTFKGVGNGSETGYDWDTWIKAESCRRTGYCIWVSPSFIGIALTHQVSFSTACGSFISNSPRFYPWKTPRYRFHVKKFYGKQKSPLIGSNYILVQLVNDPPIINRATTHDNSRKPFSTLGHSTCLY